jgi:hypothetical protein
MVMHLQIVIQGGGGISWSLDARLLQLVSRRYCATDVVGMKNITTIINTD